MAIDAAEIRGRLVLEDKDFQRGMDRAEGKFKGFGVKLGKIGLGIAAGAGAAVAGFGAVAVRAAGDLQQAVANVASIKPEIDTSAVFSALSELSTRVPQSSQQLADSLYDVFSSINVSQAEGLKLVEQFAKGATAAQTDAQTFGTSVIGVLNAYKLEVGEAGKISDLFFNTVKAGVVTGDELARSLGPVTQAAKSAGVSTNELFAAIAAVTKEGGPAAQNINNLRGILAKITTAPAQKALKALGVETQTASGEFRPLFDVIGDMKGRLAGLSQAGRAAALNKIFPDVEARQGMQTLLSQLDFAKDRLRENATAAGSTAQAYETMGATFKNQTALLANAWTAVKETVGAAILPAITPALTAFSQQLPDAIKTLRGFLDGLGPAFTRLAGIVRPVGEQVLGPFRIIADWFRANLPLMRETVRVVLAAIVGFWERHGATILGIVKPVWTIITTLVNTAIRQVLNILRLVMQLITGDWKGAWGTLQGIVKTGWAAMVVVTRNAGAALGNAVKFIFQRALEIIRGVVGGIAAIGRAIWEGLVNAIKGGVGQVAAAARDLAQGALASIKGKLGIQSPSRAMVEIGREMVNGLVVGLGESQSAILAGEKLAAQVLKALDQQTVRDQKAVRDRIKELARIVQDARVEALKETARVYFGELSPQFVALDVIRKQWQNLTAAEAKAVEGVLKYRRDLEAVQALLPRLAVGMQSLGAAITGGLTGTLGTLAGTRKTGQGLAAGMQATGMALARSIASSAQGASREVARTVLPEQQRLLEQFAAGTHQVFANAFTRIEDGFSGLFGNVYQGFKQMLVQMAAEILASELQRAFLGFLSGAVGLKLPVPQRQMGGSVTAGSPYLVGERGPELFVPRQSGRIAPNGQLAGAASYNITVNFSGPMGPNTRQNVQAGLSDALQQAERARRRSG